MNEIGGTVKALTKVKSQSIDKLKIEIKHIVKRTTVNKYTTIFILFFFLLLDKCSVFKTESSS